MLTLYSKVKIAKVVLGFVSVVIVLVSCMVVAVQYSHTNKIFSIENAPTKSTVIVLGSTVGSLELNDRVDTAIELYRIGKVQKIVVSGDDGLSKGDEISAMRHQLLASGVPDSQIIPDPAYRTMQTCAHARDRHWQDVLLVTQAVHLPRSMYLCENLGVAVTGVIADRQDYPRNIVNWLHEMFASVLAFWQIVVEHGAAGDLKGRAAISVESWYRGILP